MNINICPLITDVTCRLVELVSTKLYETARDIGEHLKKKTSQFDSDIEK